MASTRQASSTSIKRKASPTEDNDPLSELSDSSPASQSQPQSNKKRKTTTAKESTASTNAIKANQSNADLKFADKIQGTLRIATWNVCGLAASQKKGFKHYLEAEDPDILVLTETKVNNEPVDPALKSRFPYCYWSIAEKKGYSGTAILSKHKPLSITKTLPGHPDPTSIKGRIITLEFENTYLIGTYVVNAGEKLKTLDAKIKWNTHFTKYIRDLDAKKPVIWTGDLNVAPTEKDLANAKKNWNKSAGYTEAETTAFKQILDGPSAIGGKFVDVWRQLYPEDQKYTYFSYRFNCRAKGIGWRIDMFVLSERIALVMEIEGEL